MSRLEEWIVQFGSFTTCKSPGPGGQNVNKRNTKVQLSVKLTDLPYSEEHIERIAKKLQNRIDSDGKITVDCTKTRSQSQNREFAIKKLADLIKKAGEQQKKRRPTKPTKGSNQRRLQTKSKKSQLKKNRSQKNFE